MNNSKKSESTALINLQSDALLGFNQVSEAKDSQGLKSQIEMSRLFSKRGGEVSLDMRQSKSMKTID